MTMARERFQSILSYLKSSGNIRLFQKPAKLVSTITHILIKHMAIDAGCNGAILMSRPLSNCVQVNAAIQEEADTGMPDLMKCDLWQVIFQ